MKDILNKIRSIDIAPKILIIIFLTIVAFWFGDEGLNFRETENMVWTAFSVIVFYWIFFGFNTSTISQSLDIDSTKDSDEKPASNWFGNINFGWMGTKVVRGLVMFIAFIVMAILWNLSMLVIPKSGVGGAIRGGVGMWLLYWVWKNVLPRINIGTQTKENKRDDVKTRYNSEENEFSPSKTELKEDMGLYKQYQEEIEEQDEQIVEQDEESGDPLEKYKPKEDE